MCKYCSEQLEDIIVKDSDTDKPCSKYYTTITIYGDDKQLGIDADNYLRDLEGRSEEKAVAKILTDGFDYRITRKDSVNYMVTCDFDLGRVNLEINSGVVSAVSLG